jgi:type 1 glutamine amidotransferase
MKTLMFILLMLVSVLCGRVPVASAQTTKFLIVVGPSTHPPGTHEVAAGGRVIQHCLETIENMHNIQAVVSHEWPKDSAHLDSVDSLVFIGDFFPPTRMPESKSIMDKLEQMMARGCGMACIHYATGIHGDDAGPHGDHPLLRWIGGYFANRSCVHHESFAKIFDQATIEPAAPVHPVSRGWKPFKIHDEPYYNNYFGPNGNKPAANVTILATSMLPPNAPKSEAVAWCIERPDQGRGFGIVMPHFYRNWANEDLRRLIMNGIAWTAKLEIPNDGIKTKLADLSTFGAASLQPLTPAAKK